MDVVREGCGGASMSKPRMMSSVLGMFRLMVSKRGEQGAREAGSVCCLGIAGDAREHAASELTRDETGVNVDAR
jgi:hypothetical protein